MSSRASPPPKRVFDEQGAVKGVRIGDMGLDKNGTPGPNYTPGVEIHAGTTMLAEGSRGSLAKQLIAKFNLREGTDPPTFGLGFKELWQLPPGRVKPGRIEHAFGWPLDTAHLRRQLPLSPRQRSRVRRLRRRPGLRGPAASSRSRRSSSSSIIRASSRCSKAARFSPPARARSPPAAISRCRSSRCRARC